MDPNAQWNFLTFFYYFITYLCYTTRLITGGFYRSKSLGHWYLIFPFLWNGYTNFSNSTPLIGPVRSTGVILVSQKDSPLPSVFPSYLPTLDSPRVGSWRLKRLPPSSVLGSLRRWRSSVFPVFSPRGVHGGLSLRRDTCGAKIRSFWVRSETRDLVIVLVMYNEIEGLNTSKQCRCFVFITCFNH